ncbi:MAG: helicase [Gemmatimonadetes bacterium]|nr:helicase [Gemmatimonadota bacterium]MYA10984.1 helicase [Gemmatimonadota bacterium]MYJ68530.1 helicase [Gemmatimonadota bacterium]
MTLLPLRLSPEAAGVIRDEVTRAGGREVSFLAEVTRERVIVNPRAVARGNRAAVLAVARDAPEGGVMIHNHPSGLLEPSEADLRVAGRLYEEGIGSAIVTNAADGMYVVVEPPEPRTIEPLQPGELSALLAPEGPLAQLPGYEDRRGQREMLRFVATRFNQGGIGLVEAGTGTGKSLAYLVPAARWAARNGERTVVSTNTINLQEQLVRKDLEIVSGILGEELRWALVKGRANYISIRRARLAAETAPDLFPDDRSAELENLLEWIDRTEDGSRSDLPFVPSEDVWEEVRSETDACLRAKCPFFQQCHYQRARRAGAAADLVIVNHALFFSDLAIRILTDNFRDAAVLPPYKRVVFDEAHHLEDAATPRLGSETTRIGMYRALSRLDRGGKGILASTRTTLGELRTSLAARRLHERVEQRARPLVAKARAALNDFFALMEPWALAHAERGSLRLGRPERTGHRGGAHHPSTPAGPEPAADPGIGDALENLLVALGDLQRELELVADRLGEDEELRAALEGRLLDLQSSAGRLGRVGRALRLCLVPGGDDHTMVRWLDVRRSARRGARTANLVFAAAPVELGPVLAEHLFANLDTAVLTSATMAVKGDFGYLRRRLGLGGAGADDAGLLHDPTLGDTRLHSGGNGPAVDEAVFGSPFDHARQSALIVPTDLPGARGSGGAISYNDATARVVFEMAHISGGGLFALFTSFSALRAVAAALRDMGADGRWPLHVQGEADRSALLRRFARSGDAVLLGTSSFWEGVDVPGRPLRALVIQKLPFRVPTEPLTEARLEAMTARGENSFWGLMVPDAAVRLKQGIGRLIRSRTDRGAVVLLDDRLLTRRYGRTIREALPPMPLYRGPWEEVRQRAGEFY